MSRRTLVFLIAATLFAVNCAESPEIPISDIISVGIVGEDPVYADGKSEVEIKVKINKDTRESETILVQSSSGQLYLGTTPEGSSSSQLEIKGGFGKGEIFVKMIVSRVPGTVYIQAKIGDYASSTTFEQLPAKPDSLSLKAEKSVLKGDGTDKTTLEVYLKPEIFKGYSEGWYVYLTACCSDADDPENSPIPCSLRPPFEVQEIVDMGSNQKVNVEIKTDVIYESDSDVDEKISAWIIGQAWDPDDPEFDGPNCENIEVPIKTRDAEKFTITPIDDSTS